MLTATDIINLTKSNLAPKDFNEAKQIYGQYKEFFSLMKENMNEQELNGSANSIDRIENFFIKFDNEFKVGSKREIPDDKLFRLLGIVSVIIYESSRKIVERIIQNLENKKQNKLEEAKRIEKEQKRLLKEIEFNKEQKDKTDLELCSIQNETQKHEQDIEKNREEIAKEIVTADKDGTIRTEVRQFVIDIIKNPHASTIGETQKTLIHYFAQMKEKGELIDALCKLAIEHNNYDLFEATYQYSQDCGFERTPWLERVAEFASHQQILSHAWARQKWQNRVTPKAIAQLGNRNFIKEYYDWLSPNEDNPQFTTNVILALASANNHNSGEENGAPALLEKLLTKISITHPESYQNCTNQLFLINPKLAPKIDTFLAKFINAVTTENDTEIRNLLDKLDFSLEIHDAKGNIISIVEYLKNNGSYLNIKHDLLRQAIVWLNKPNTMHNKLRVCIQLFSHCLTNEDLTFVEPITRVFAPLYKNYVANRLYISDPLQNDITALINQLIENDNTSHVVTKLVTEVNIPQLFIDPRGKSDSNIGNRMKAFSKNLIVHSCKFGMDLFKAMRQVMNDHKTHFDGNLVYIMEVILTAESYSHCHSASALQQYKVQLQEIIEQIRLIPEERASYCFNKPEEFLAYAKELAQKNDFDVLAKTLVSAIQNPALHDATHYIMQPTLLRKLHPNQINLALHIYINKSKTDDLPVTELSEYLTNIRNAYEPSLLKMVINAPWATNALFRSIELSDSKHCGLLFENGVSPNQRDSSRRLPLETIIGNEKLELSNRLALIQLFINHDADLNILTSTGTDIIAYATAHGHSDEFELLYKTKEQRQNPVTTLKK